MRRGLLAGRDELSKLSERIATKPFDVFYDRLQRRCSLILESSPMTEHNWQMLAAQGHQAAAVNAARACQGRILDLLVAHHIDANRAYRDRAVEELKALASWSTWVDPANEGEAVDACTAEAAIAATIGLDWLWEELTEADRIRLIRAIRTRVIEPYCRSVKDKAWWYESYQSTNAVINGGCGLAALALSDEDPKAEKALELALAGLDGFFNALGREGGWDEGTSFWGHAVRGLLLLNEAATRVLDDQRIIHRRGMDTTGLFPIYFTPNGHPAGFGESSTVPLCGSLYLLVTHFGLKEVAWWLDTYGFGGDVSTDGWSAEGLALLCRPDDLETPTDPSLHSLKIFNEIGWAAMADQWPHPAMYVSAKTGDLSACHSHRDMNAIQLQLDGEMVLVNPGLADVNLSAAFLDDQGLPIQATGHNTLVVGRRDQAIDARGSIVDAIEEPHYRWVACDAQDACGGDARFIRHVVMMIAPDSGKGQTALIVDEVHNPTAESVDVYWHLRGDPKLDEKAQQLTVACDRGKLFGAFASNVPSRVTHRTGSRRRDSHHILRVAAGDVTVGFFAAAFSRDKIHKAIQIDDNGKELAIQLPGATVSFKRRKSHFQLTNVALA